MAREKSGQGFGKPLPLFYEIPPEGVFPRQLELRSQPSFAPEAAPGTCSPVELRRSSDVIVPVPAEGFAVDRVHRGERAPQRGVIPVSAQLKVLEHEEGLLTRLSLAHRGGNPGTGCGERREAIGLRGETVECRAGVCLGEGFAPAAPEYEAKVEAASRDRHRALDSERARDI